MNARAAGALSEVSPRCTTMSANSQTSWCVPEMTTVAVLPVFVMLPVEVTVPVPLDKVRCPVTAVDTGFGLGANCAKAGFAVMRTAAAMRPVRMRECFMESVSKTVVRTR